jgi:outer membrane lipoprotein-sorting protein
MRASADVTLPARSAAQLLVDLQTAQLNGASGTVVERANLGLPALPDSIGGGGSSQLNSLVTGSHTLRVWYSGPDKARVALLGALGESDVIRNGNDLWVWSSSGNTASHSTVTGNGDKSKAPGVTPDKLPSTPQEAANKMLAALDPTTSVTTQSGDTVAGRSAYELVLAPKDTRSLVSQVKIAIDGTVHVPLRVQVYAKGHTDSPAFETGFQQVSFTRPDAGVFKFSPPAGAKVTDSTKNNTPDNGQVEPKTAVIGKGWTSVLVARVPQSAVAGATTPNDRQGRSTQEFLNGLPQANGAWGSGRVLQSRLFSALLTDDGRILVGAVSRQQLEAAAGDPAAALK